MRFTDNQSLDTASMANLDILAGTDVSSGTDKKFTLANLASWFLGQFSGLSLAGESQTVQAAIDGIESAKADADGSYDGMTVGTSKQLLSESYTENLTPYKFRRSPYTDRLSESIVGCSVAWNQLVNTSDTSVTVPSGHKYLSRISGTDAMGASTGTAISVAGTDNVHDLTVMFGTTVADALYAMGADGVSLFRSWYPNDYYEYSAPTLEHVSGLESHEMVGLNAWDEEWETGGISNTDGTNVSGTNRIRSKNYISILSGNDYYFRYGGSYTVGLRFYDTGKNYIGADTISGSRVLQYGSRYLPSGTAYLRFILIGTATYNNDICINLSDPTRNGQYKPYESHTYALDALLTLRGLLKYDATKGIYADGDTYKADGTVTRKYGVRAYQSGDESNTAVLTDGTNTVYELATPTTESAEPYDAIQITDGTEEYITDCIAPVGHESKYYQNLRSKIESLPALPTTAGAYRLTVTVSSGKATYTWTAS